MERPEIKTPLPGPKAQEILKEHRKYISPSYPKGPDLVFDRAEGVWIWDVDGNKFLDMLAGVAVNSTGHRHPEVLAAIEEALGRFLHVSTDFYHDLEVKLAKKLAEIFPREGDRQMVFFTNSGTESTEAGLKLARHHTGRQYFIAFEGSFHGRTFGSLSVTSSKNVHRGRFSPLVPGVFFIPYPNSYRPPFNASPEKATDQLLDYVEHVLFERIVPPEEVAAFVIEPIQGEGGYVMPLPDFFPKLRALADRYGILIIDDEVQAGLGRTGRWFAIEHWNTTPDIIGVAKGIASGLPMGAMIAKAEIMTWPRGAHANTFGGNPVAASAALKTLQLIEESLMENARVVGDYFLKRLKELQERYEEMGDVRGKGLMVGIEFVKDRETKEPYPEFRDRVVLELFNRGVVSLGCGPTSLRFSPPLTIGKEHVDVAVDLLDEALKATREALSR
ncbi:MAG: acetyl ornithine aminotransferase family protein [Thermotogae bacterium]|nr:acetyl ornithine aminotransferase family protein [Thermotogota bacterium]